jgi:hypothetical protein
MTQSVVAMQYRFVRCGSCNIINVYLSFPSRYSTTHLCASNIQIGTSAHYHLTTPFKHYAVSFSKLWSFPSSGDVDALNVLYLTLNLLKTTIVAPPSNASKWQVGFNSAFKGLNENIFLSVCNDRIHNWKLIIPTSSIRISIDT